VHDVTIVGGGIIGVCAAIALQDEGLSVGLVDRGLETEGASYGNSGLLAVGEIVPLSKPGILPKLPGWLLDPQSPLFVRSPDVIWQMPWLLRFLRAGRRKRVLEIAAALASLTRHAEDDYRALLGAAGIDDNLVPSEDLIVFDSKADYEADRPTWDIRTRHGFPHRFLAASEVRSLEPALGGPVTCGALLEGWFRFSEPGLMRDRLAAFFVARGGSLTTGSVERILTGGGRATALQLADGNRVAVKALVISAGAWSRTLLRDLGIRLPLAALQGYHHQVPEPGVSLTRAVVYANGGFVVTPMERGLRIAGTIEVAGPDPKPDYARADIIARKATTIVPGLNIAGGRQWMGPRPFMPDTLPVIDRAPHHGNVILALGHGQLGMTLGPTTAKRVADLVVNRTPSTDLSPFRATRF